MSDRCAACFAELKPAPLGGRYACACNPPGNFEHLRGAYLSEVAPQAPFDQEPDVTSKHGRPPLFLYG